VPDVVIGHGVGELVAAWVAGAWTLDELAELTVARARALEACPPGELVALMSGAVRVEAALSGWPEVAIAAWNGADAVAVGGPAAALRALAARMNADGVTTFPLPARHPLQTRWMAPAADALRPVATRIGERTLEIELISTLTGAALESVGVAHLTAQLAAPVRFADALATLGQRMPGVFVEIGPVAQLSGFVRRALDLRGRAMLTAYRRDREGETLLEALAEGWVRGAAVDLDALARFQGGELVALPATPFDRRRHWVEDPRWTAPRPAADAAPKAAPRAEPADPAALVLATAARLLGAPEAEIDPRRPLAWQGFDSLMATELKRAIDRAFGVDIPADEVVSGPSVQELVAAIERLRRA
jgi:acyl transferase domain-containing protein